MSTVICNGLVWLTVYAFLYLCTCEALEDEEKFPVIQKRIFCNPSGCRNGKRGNRSDKKYNMFHRIRTGKRTSDSALYDNYDQYSSESLGVPYDDWPSDNQHMIPMDKSLSSRVSNAVEANDNIPLFSSDVGKTIKATYNLDVDMLKLYEKYKILKDAEEIVRYLKSSIKKDNNKRQLKNDDLSKLRSWLERRK